MTSMKLKLNKAWDCSAGVLEPGLYAIPGQISETLAKCAVADGAGQIVDGKGARRGRKAVKGAPENKTASE